MAHLSPVPNDPTDFEAWLQSLPPDQAQQIAEQLSLGGSSGAGANSLAPDPTFAFQPNQPIDVPDPPAEPVRLSLTINLVDADPAIWRDIVVPGALTLDELHDAIQVTMGWTDSHLHRFWPSSEPRSHYFITDFDRSEGDVGTLESQVRVDQVLRSPRDSLLYEYDFGDSWEHTITVAAIDPGDETSIECTDGGGACPPEDVGGIGFYNEIADWFRSRGAGPPPGGMDYRQAMSLTQSPAGSLDRDRFDPDALDPRSGSTTLRALGGPPASVIRALPDELAQLIEELPPSARHIINGWLMDTTSNTMADVDAALDTATARELVRPWLIVLDAVGEGTDLTKAGWLKPAVVSQIFTDLGLGEWWIGKGNREDLTPPVANLREDCQSLGLLSKRKGRLQPTARARKLKDDPREMFWHIADRLPLGRGEFERRCSWLYLAGYPSISDTDLVHQIVRLMRALGWRTHEGQLEGRDVRHGCHATTSILDIVGHAGQGKPGPFSEWTPHGDLLARAAVWGRQSS